MASDGEMPAPLAPSALRNRCDPATLPFDSTEGLAGPDGFIGQDRAMEAIRLSLTTTQRGFNLFVLGESGMGRHRAVREELERRAGELPAPDDWVYVNNFDAPDRPRALRLPPGTAQRLKRAMQQLVDDLAVEIPAMFESEEYQAQRRALEEEYGERQERDMAAFAERAKAEGAALLRTPVGFMIGAVREGKVLKTEEYNALDESERKEIDERIARLQQDLATVLRNAPRLGRELRGKVEALHAGMAERVVSGRAAELLEPFAAIEATRDYLDEVRRDMIANAELFVAARAKEHDGAFPEAIRKYHRDPPFERYAVNVMVGGEAGAEGHAPFVSEELPTLGNLTGRIEHASQMGALVTNFTMIKPGSLHRANGGFLMIDAARVLSEPYAWDALKRCLYTRAITITALAERMSLVSTTSLQPDPIPLEVRVVLVGDRRLHALLTMLDPDFRELFKVQADFEGDIDRSDDTVLLMARLIGAQARREGLLPLSAGGVARLIDEAVRLAEDSRKLTLQVGALADRIRESDHYARSAGRALIGPEDVERTVLARERRASRVRDRIHEMIGRRTILIDTAGGRIGQVNGLSVLSMGEYRFGQPSRITARVRMGAGKLVDIEREVELGGPLHSKGVFILGGYLTATFALDTPFSLHASLVFEQSYGGVDGDSASSAELYALLSALAELPIDQGFAVTGSVNQLGEVQAIGGVNEKIEGFFDVCTRAGLTGRQGVLIPRANVENLMLRPDIVAAAEKGQFRVIPVTSIDEGIALLTGLPAGIRGADGAYPEDSVNGRVERRLRDFAEMRRRFGTGDHARGGEK